MELLKFDEIFNDEDVSNYDLFIGKLKQLKENGHTTKEILGLIYQYYQKYVTYNYDQLQIVKLGRMEQDEPGFKCHTAFDSINDRILEINKVSQKGKLSLQQIIDSGKCEEPYTLIEAMKLLDDAFMEVEGRPLTDRNKTLLFKSYGEIKHIPYRPAKPRSETQKIGMSERLEHDEIIPAVASNYQPVYNNAMLIDGVCDEYARFEAKICRDLHIKHLRVEGVGTTGHAWSLIYLPEEQRWVHFDMTMVKFYQDGWIKEHEPYTEQDWIAATTEEIFRMQPTRQIHSINGKKRYFDINNYGELDVRDFLKISEVEPIHYPDKVLKRPLKDRGCIVTREELAQIVELPCLKATLLLYDKNIQTIGTSANKENIRT